MFPIVLLSVSQGRSMQTEIVRKTPVGRVSLASFLCRGVLLCFSCVTTASRRPECQKSRPELRVHHTCMCLQPDEPPAERTPPPEWEDEGVAAQPGKRTKEDPDWRPMTRCRHVLSTVSKGWSSFVVLRLVIFRASDLLALALLALLALLMGPLLVS